MPDVEAFWRRFVAATGIDGPYTAWGFGSSPEQASELGLLVRAGPKRATASRGSDCGPEEPMPVPGAWTEGEGLLFVIVAAIAASVFARATLRLVDLGLLFVAAVAAHYRARLDENRRAST